MSKGLETYAKHAIGFRIVCEDDLARLLNDSKKLAALEAGGVDNWEWYEQSMEDGGMFDE